MDTAQSTSFKGLINPMIDLAVRELGGLISVRDTYKQMPAMLDMIAGWVIRDLWLHRQAALQEPRTANLEEKRRIYDLVRLKLDTESSTS